MLRGILLCLALCVAPSAALGQLVREHDTQGLRSFHGQTSNIRRSFQSDAEARAVFKEILAVSGLAGMEDRMTIRASAETHSAEASIERLGSKEERFIFYNAIFMEDIAKKTKNYWSMVAILAHEVGHHIRLHTIIPGRDHEFELEADYQAGFILRRMGATLEQTQAAFRTIGTDVDTVTHPARSQRIQAATLGWKDGASNVARLPAQQPLDVATQEWGRVNKGSIAELEAFALKHASSPEANEARARIQELKAQATSPAKPTVSAPPETQAATASGTRQVFIEPLVNGFPLSANSQGLPHAKDVAHEFCKQRGFERALAHLTQVTDGSKRPVVQLRGGALCGGSMCLTLSRIDCVGADYRSVFAPALPGSTKEQATFVNPRVDGFAISSSSPGLKDNKGVADAFCQEQGFKEAIAFLSHVSDGRKTPVKKLRSGELCGNSLCTTLTRIDCRG
jgi:hypothetical protein